MSANPESTRKPGLQGWAKGLFWGWNVVFAAVIFLGLIPVEWPSLIQGIRSGVTPVSYLVFFVALVAIPLAAMLIGALFLRKFPYRLFALGYVVEWPLLLILLFRFFFIGEGNPAISVLLIWLALAEAAFLWHLLDDHIDEYKPVWRYLRLSGLTLLFSGTIYAAAWLIFYVPPVAAVVYQSLRDIVHRFGLLRPPTFALPWYELPLIILQYILLLFSASLILMMPIASPILAARAWLHSLRTSWKGSGHAGTLLAALLPLGIILAAVGAGMAQPQHEAFKLLENPPTTQQQAQVLLQREKDIRSGLLNAYLAPFRYMSNVGEVRHVSDLYQMTLGASKESAWRLEQAYEVVIRPLLYVPVHPVEMAATDNQVSTTESREAATLYQRFFDTTIIQGERPAIVKAVRSNANSSRAELAWQAVDDREVRLNRQEVNVTEHGDWAEVQLHEVYENHTNSRQEVVYYFSLPESAVVTGLWLGNTSERSQAFPYRVAPRGVAQAVYRNEIRYNRDPALVEQIGPRQYRLRAFPLEPQRWINNATETKPGPELHLWMTYTTVALDGAWPLPQLAEKRNVYWDGDTARLINGKPMQVSEAAWLPESIPATQDITRTAHRVDFPGGQSVLASPVEGMSVPGLPARLRFAVVLDRSFSMRDRANQVNQVLVQLKQVAAAGPEPDLYLTASQYRAEAPSRIGLSSMKPVDLLTFGGQNAAELLAQFEALQDGKQYDAIVVITDHTGYELGSSDTPVQVPDAPVWVVHLGGFPLGYDDATLQAIQASGGGIASTLDEALSRYAASQGASGRYDVVDGYVWQSMPSSEIDTTGDTSPVKLQASPAQDGFTALASRRLVLAMISQNHRQLDQLPVLDSLNKLAVEQGIVTPYSSMIVLVNPAQQGLLDQLSERDDRYQREVEDVADTTQANPFAVTGVPEPEEWLLLTLAVGMLIYAGWRKRAERRIASIKL